MLPFRRIFAVGSRPRDPADRRSRSDLLEPLGELRPEPDQPVVTGAAFAAAFLAAVFFAVVFFAAVFFAGRLLGGLLLGRRARGRGGRPAAPRPARW